MKRDLTVFFITFALILVSTIADRRKTLAGLVSGFRMLKKLLPQFLMLLVLVSFFLGVFSQEFLAQILEDSGFLGPVIAAIVGSLALIPGFIAYPLAGVLLNQGVGLTVIAVFITTLMMVGILTFPVEKEYFGTPLALLRNILSFLGALAIGFLVGAIL